MSDIQGSCAIVTGASSGIGTAICAALAAEGMHVVLAARNRERLQAVAEALPNPENHMVAPTDVTVEADVRRLVATALERYGRVDLLVNNAGVGAFKPIGELTLEEFDTVIRANLHGPFLCTREVTAPMVNQGGGTIVMISSIAGRHGFAGGAAYCASKFGLVGLAECAFHDLRGHDIRVVTICPGSVDTPFFENANTASPNPERVLQPQRALVRELDIRPTNPGRG